MTFRQIAYIISDFSKTISDDSIINIDHIVFLISKYRNYILNQYFANNAKKEISDANYQTICVPLEKSNSGLDFCGKGLILKSKAKIPYTLTIGSKSIYPPAGFMYGNIELVNNIRFKYVGNNKFFKNTIYATIGPDNYLYLKSASSDFRYLKEVRITALFTDVEDAARLDCDTCNSECDPLDNRFPLEDSYLPLLMKLVVQDVVGASWRLKDDENNATDDLATFAQLIQRYANNAFKKMVNPQDPESNNQSNE